MKNRALVVIVVLAIALRLVFAFAYHEVWWDAGVYLGMGKFLFSQGASGLWEHIRPPLLPILLGVMWRFGLDPLLFGRLLEILLFAGVVAFTYLLTKDWFGEKEAIWSSLIVALSPIFFYLSFHQYTEIPSVFFVLLALWLLKKHPFLSGLSLGLAVLSKFPAGIFVLPVAITLLVWHKWKDAFF
ncbi:MAG TPA: glycosyltransferase family 39 protein, partial [Candidatus Nanoarchaeia archaeon]|nr:glycosyltransferase family 39 protein [Candidatus Nanoarchaeia archaeon]